MARLKGSINYPRGMKMEAMRLSFDEGPPGVKSLNSWAFGIEPGSRNGYGNIGVAALHQSPGDA
jgi:hypothetical protein